MTALNARDGNNVYEFLIINEDVISLGDGFIGGCKQLIFMISIRILTYILFQNKIIIISELITSYVN